MDDSEETRVEFAAYEPGARSDGTVPSTRARIRALRAEDLDELASLNSTRQRIPIEAARSWARRELDRTRRDPGRHVVLVALDRRVVIGYGKALYFEPAPDGPSNTPPAGWHLGGLVVRPDQRRRGVGSALVRARLDWIEAREPLAWYFASERNRATIDLHAAFGFREVTRDFQVPGVRFSGGADGILFRAEAPWEARPRRQPDSP